MQTLDETFLEMRWRCLSLAADFDRIERNAPGPNADVRLHQLREALGIVMGPGMNRAEKVQLLFSDKTSPPARPPARMPASQNRT